MNQPPISSHKNYNPKTLRIELPEEDINKLPIKEVSDSELDEVMKTWEYNPVFKQKDIIGYDLKYRYIRKIKYFKTKKKEL